jgi:hypothetical protein
MMTGLFPNRFLVLLAAAALQTAVAEEVIFVDWDGAGTESQQDLPTEGIPSKVSSEAFSYTFEESASWKPREGYNPPPDKTGDFGLAISSSMGHGPAAPHILRLDPRGGGSFGQGSF